MSACSRTTDRLPHAIIGHRLLEFFGSQLSYGWWLPFDRFIADAAPPCDKWVAPLCVFTQDANDWWAAVGAFQFGGELARHGAGDQDERIMTPHMQVERKVEIDKAGVPRVVEQCTRPNATGRTDWLLVRESRPLFPRESFEDAMRNSFAFSAAAKHADKTHFQVMGPPGVGGFSAYSRRSTTEARGTKATRDRTS